MGGSRLIVGIRTFLLGLSRGLIFLLVFVIIIPYALSRLASPLLQGAQPPAPLPSLSYLLALLILFTSLEAAAAVYRRSVYGFLISSLSKVLGLLFIVNALGGGTIGGTLSAEGATISVRVDISPLLYLIAAFTFALIIYSSFDLFQRD